MGVNKSVAVLGYGQIGKRHVEVIDKNEYLQVHSVVDNNYDKIKNLNYPTFSTLNDLLESKNNLPDLISICTPNYLHITHSELCLEKKIRVLIEKPISISLKEAEKFRNTIAHDNVAFTVTQNRYSHTIQLLKEIIKQGKIGTITNIQVNCFWNRSEDYYDGSNWRGKTEKDGGVLYTQFSHFIDLLVWLFNDIKPLYARSANFVHQKVSEFDDSGVISFSTKDGAMGSIHYTTAAYSKNMESRIVLLGTKGSICIAGQYMNEIAWATPDLLIENVERQMNSSNNYGNYQGSAANHHLLYADIAEHWNNPNDVTSSSVDDAIKVVQFIEQVHNLAKVS